MRSELRAWFRTQAQSLAPAYEGAVELLANDKFPGRERFIAHAVRDIADRLVFALEPQQKAPRVQYEEHLDEIDGQWISPDSVCQPETAAPPAENISIPRKLARLIDVLVIEHRKRRGRPSAYDLLFQFLVKASRSPPPSIEQLVKSFKKTRDWFMRYDHFPADPQARVDEGDLQEQFRAFELAIHGMVGTYFAGVDVLDEILQQANQ
jgi:hypothetical protein